MSEQSMNCAGCGKAVLPNWKACPSCRKPVEQPTNPPAPLVPPSMIQAGDNCVVSAEINNNSPTEQDFRGSIAGGGQPLIIVGSGSVVKAIINISVDAQKYLDRHQLNKRAVQPGDSLSIRNDDEREFVKQLVARYRALPEQDRRQLPALLNDIGKMEVVAGDFDAALSDFQQFAELAKTPQEQAEGHFNAYQTALERRDWPTAIEELIKAVKLDHKRFAPFPARKYGPIHILGAGGFGVAFLCKHKYMDVKVVVKTLMLQDLGRDTDEVFSEARLLRALDHPAIIRISDCGYADEANRSRPFLVMDCFEGGTLEEHIKKHGPLSVENLLAIARPIAEGLHAAHSQGVLHRDVKPANVLVRKVGREWMVKVIDFGLALRQKVVQKSMSANSSTRNKTLVGRSMTGTMDFAAPEQMGKREGEALGPYSDIYAWAKTCCYALFQTTQPLLKHWSSLPRSLAVLLEKCLDEDPKKRPSGFAEVLTGLGMKESPFASSPSWNVPEPPVLEVALATTASDPPALTILPAQGLTAEETQEPEIEEKRSEEDHPIRLLGCGAIVCGTIILILLAAKAFLVNMPVQNDSAEPFPEATVTAWKDAGAEVGWMRQNWVGQSTDPFLKHVYDCKK